MTFFANDVASTPVYNSGNLVETNYLSRTPWATPGNPPDPGEENARRRLQRPGFMATRLARKGRIRARG